MSSTQCELSERGWDLASSLALEERAAVTCSTLPSVAGWLSLVVEGAVGSAPDATLPALRDLKRFVGARRELEAVDRKNSYSVNTTRGVQLTRFPMDQCLLA